jgi:hypothetical protein
VAGLIAFETWGGALKNFRGSPVQAYSRPIL